MTATGSDKESTHSNKDVPTQVDLLQAQVDLLAKLVENQENEMDDLEKWATHPNKHLERPTLVDLLHFRVVWVGRLNCKDCTVGVNVLMWVGWYDPRLEDYSSTILPKTLWTPRLVLDERIPHEFEETVRECHLDDKKTGHVYMLTQYAGIIRNKMESIHDFPFDDDSIQLTFYACEYRCRDGSEGNVAFKEDYRFLVDAPLRMSVEGYDYSGRKTKPFVLPEWELKGIEGEYIKTSYVQDVFRVTIDVSRKPNSYIMRVILPLFITVLLGIGAMYLDDAGSRLGHYTGLLFATFALLFIVTQDLPNGVHNTTFGLTRIGQVTTVATILIVLAGILSARLGSSKNENSIDADYLAIGLPCAFVIFTLTNLLPPYLRRRRKYNKRTSHGIKTKNHPYTTLVIKPEFNDEIYNLESFKDRWKNARKHRKEITPDDTSYDEMLSKAKSNHGIVKVTSDQERALSWEQWRDLSEIQGCRLATRQELEASEINHGKDDFWNPVSRDDKEGDCVEIGESPLMPGERYASYQDYFDGVVGWDQSIVPQPWKPFDFIYAKKRKCRDEQQV